jgi:hypothetical protein
MRGYGATGWRHLEHWRHGAWVPAFAGTTAVYGFKISFCTRQFRSSAA